MKALALLSGGLDSALAVKIVQQQGIDVVALNFVSPFCTCTRGCSIVNLAKRINVPVKVEMKGKEYIKLVRNPKYGYGKNMNPCIDCKIFILKKAKKVAKEIGAKFIFTGEVIGQRPMSQQFSQLKLIEKEAKLQGKIVRPLCAKLLEPTEAEKKGWIDRKKLLSIQGRARKIQIDLAKKLEIDGFLCGGSGCILTNKEFASKLRDLFKHKKRLNSNDIALLKTGRHFRLDNNKIIVGRNEAENKMILESKNKSDFMFEAKDFVGPTTILQGPITKKAIETAAGLTAKYSDADKDEVVVKYGKDKFNKEIKVNKIKDVDRLRIL